VCLRVPEVGCSVRSLPCSMSTRLFFRVLRSNQSLPKMYLAGGSAPAAPRWCDQLILDSSRRSAFDQSLRLTGLTRTTERPRDALTPTAGSRRSPHRLTPSLIATREHSRGAVLALPFGVRPSSFWRVVRRPSGCARRHPQHRLPSAVPCALRPGHTAYVLAIIAAPVYNTFGKGPNARRVSRNTPDAAGGAGLQLRQC